MFKKIALIVIALFVIAVGGVLVVAATKPDEFRVQRSASIQAPPEKIFPLINEFGNWPSWSPYEHRDPTMKRTMSGPAGGKGAAYAWDGNSEIGAGSMEITDSAPPRQVTLRLDFTRPFEAHNNVVFTLEPRGDLTEITWAMSGPVPYMAKIVHVIFDMDEMVGKDFTEGLAKLKAVAEKK